MKKLNTKGFTLIELLAVITIMGILMMVAIPTVSRTIENSRKDTFIDTAKSYINGAKNMWAADNLRCDVDSEGKSYLSSAVPTGTYYVKIDTTSESVPVLLEQGGKSSWGSRDIKGYIKVVVAEKDISTVDAAGNTVTNKTRQVTYYPVFTDGIHGINVTPATASAEVTTPVAGEKLVRGDIKMSGAGYPAIDSLGNNCVEV